MATNKAYRIRHAPHAGSDVADACVRKVRSDCIARGTSLHAWVAAWAHASGRDPHATYRLTLATLRRRVARGAEPKGRIGGQIVADLWAYLYGDQERAA